MPIIEAGPAEILRASQKDKSYLENIKSSVLDIFQRTLGNRFTLHSVNVINASCEIAYYYLTTIGLRQTLGEEYTGIVQTKRGVLPSFKILVFMTAAHCLGQPLFNTVYDALKSSLRTGVLSELTSENCDFINRFLSIMKSFPTTLLKLHLIMFYLGGSYYHLSKRLGGVKYVTTIPENSKFGVKPFKMLGIILIIHYILNLIISMSSRSTQLQKFKSQKNSIIQSNICPLCLEKRKNSSATPCGHIFCWKCIHEALSVRDACPICRRQTISSEVIPLLNFS